MSIRTSLLAMLLSIPLFLCGQEASRDDQLIRAVHSNDLAQVKALVASGADLNYVNPDGRTPLLSAVMEENNEVLAFLVKAGADVNLADTYEQPLHSAAFWSQRANVELLLACGADVNIASQYGATPMHSIARAIRITDQTILILNILLKKGADIHAKKTNSYTPLLIACKRPENTELAKWFIDHGADVNAQVENYRYDEKYHGFSPLHIALLTKNYALAEYLLRHGAEVNRPVSAMLPNSWVDNYANFSPLHFVAMDTAALHLLDLLMEKGASPDAKLYQYWTPLKMACAERNKSLALALLKYDSLHLHHPQLSMEELYTQTMEKIRLDSLLYAAAEDPTLAMDYLSQGADLYYCEFGFRLGSVFSKSLESGNTGLSSRLLDQGIDVLLADREGMTALHYACSKEKNLALAERIIDMGARLDAMSYERPTYKDEKPPYYTPLLYAICKNNLGLTKLLVDKGAVKNVFTNGQEPANLESRPILYSISNDNREMSEFLIQHGFDLEQAIDTISGYYRGYTALHLASSKNDTSLAQLLLDHGADVNHFSHRWERHPAYTPLHLAVTNQHNSLVDMLIQSGADLDLLSDGKYAATSALHLCVENDNKEALERLLHAGANIDVADREGNTPLNFALSRQKTAYAEIFLSGNANIQRANANGYSPLHYTCLLNDLGDSMAIKLIDMGADLHTKIKAKDAVYPGFTPLHLAAMNGNFRLIYYMMNQGADLSAVNAIGLTPAAIALSYNKHDAASLLENPMYIVFYYYKEDLQSSLLEALNEDPSLLNATDHTGSTLLHMLVKEGRMDILSQLNAVPEDINAQDSQGRTALFYAVAQGRKPIADFLLKHKAKPDIPDHEGYTCYYYANDNMKHELDRYGAKKTWVIVPKLEVKDPSPERIFSLVMFDKDRKALSAGSGGKIKLWDLSSGKQLRSLDCNAKRLILNKNEDLVLAIGERLEIWNIKTGFKVYEIPCSLPGTSLVDLHPSGRAIIFGDGQDLIRLDLLSNQKEKILSLQGDSLSCIKYCRSGNGIAFGTQHGLLGYTDLVKGRTKMSSLVDKAAIEAIDISPDNKHILAVCEVPETANPWVDWQSSSSLSDSIGVYIWNTKKGKMENSFIADLKSIQHVQWIADDAFILAGNQWDYPYLGPNNYYYPEDEETQPDVNNVNRLRVLKYLNIRKKQYTATPLHSFQTGANYIIGEKWEYDSPRPWREDDKNASVYNQISAFAMNDDGSSFICAEVDYSFGGSDITTGGTTMISQSHALDKHRILTCDAEQNKQNIIVASSPQIAVSLANSGSKVLLNCGDSLLFYKGISMGETLSKHALYPHISKNKSMELRLWNSEKGFYSYNYYERNVLGWNVRRPAPIRQYEIGWNASDLELSPDSKKLLYTQPGSEHETVNVMDLLYGEVTMARYVKMSGWLRKLKVHPDGRSFFIGSSEGEIIKKDLADFETIQSYDGSRSDIQAIGFANDGELLLTGGADNILRSWNTESGKMLKQFYGHTSAINDICVAQDDGYILTCSDDKLVNLWETESGRLLTSLEGHHSEVKEVRFISRNRAISSATNGEMIIWDLEKHAEIVRILPFPNGELAMVTPDMYYYAPKSVLKDLSFHVGDNYFNFEQFDLKYNRPDIVLERVGLVGALEIELFRKASEKRLLKSKVVPDALNIDWHTPGLSILNKEAIPRQVESKVLKLDIEALDTKYPLHRLNVWINDVPLFGSNGRTLKEPTGAPLKIPVNLTLSPGMNKIEVAVENSQGTKSLKDHINVTYSPAAVVKPTLYLASICCADFHQDSYDLNYAVKDGRDMARQFEASEAFSKVHIDTLFNEAVTMESIQALKTKYLNSDVNDHVIVHIAGHGLLDNNLDFYFPVPETDFMDPAPTAISYALLEGLLDSIPARKKILMMDACHSGEIDEASLVEDELESDTLSDGVSRSGFTSSRANGQHTGIGLENSFTLMQELFTDLNVGSGAIVISAAAGDSFAYESDEWQNGVFTFSVLDGLKSLKADRDRNGTVSVHELQSYVFNQVNQLTKGEQQPTSRQENLNLDFRIW